MLPNRCADVAGVIVIEQEVLRVEILPIAPHSMQKFQALGHVFQDGHRQLSAHVESDVAQEIVQGSDRHPAVHDDNVVPGWSAGDPQAFYDVVVAHHHPLVRQPQISSQPDIADDVAEDVEWRARGRRFVWGVTVENVRCVSHIPARPLYTHVEAEIFAPEDPATRRGPDHDRLFIVDSEGIESNLIHPKAEVKSSSDNDEEHRERRQGDDRHELWRGQVSEP